MFVDDDSDSEDAFEIGIANANKKSLHQYNFLQDDESIDSFAKPSNRGGVHVIEHNGPPMMTGHENIPDFNMNDFMNSQGNRRRIQTANKQENQFMGGATPYDNKRPIMAIGGPQSINQATVLM